MTSRLRILLVACALLLAVTPVPARTEAPVRVDTVNVISVSQLDAPALRDFDAWYTFAATIEPPPPPRPPASKREGTTGAQAKQARAAVTDTGPIVDLILDVFGNAGPDAVRVARCESEFDPSARNASGASGLFQIMLPTHTWRFEAHGWSAGDWADPYKNTVVARDIYAESGWSPWSCKP